MKAQQSATPGWVAILWIVCLAVPLLILLSLPGGTTTAAGLWLWIMLLLFVWLIVLLVAGQTQTEEPADTGDSIGPQMLAPEEQLPIVRELMDVRVAQVEDGVQVFRGRLRERAGATFQRLKSDVSDTAIPLLQEDEQFGAAIVLLPKDGAAAALKRPVRPWVHWLLFGLTFVTTTYAGAMHQGVDLGENPERFTAGLPYSIGLLLILGLHELGHYFTAKYHGIHVTPPFFIPVPFALGTFGAFIQMRSPTEDRRALFDVAVAGPLAGLIVAVPALLLGLETSQVIPGSADVPAGDLGVGPHGTSVGSSMLFAFLAKAVMGDALQYGHMLRLSPLAFAGWLGLLVTALNLLPIGQLDGGHMARAMFGQRVGRTISSVAMWSLFLLAIFVWPALLFWAIIVFFIAGRGTPPLNDITRISPGRRWLGYATFLILALILAPLPHGFYHAAGIYCPYM